MSPCYLVVVSVNAERAHACLNFGPLSDFLQEAPHSDGWEISNNLIVILLQKVCPLLSGQMRTAN